MGGHAGKGRFARSTEAWGRAEPRNPSASVHRGAPAFARRRLSLPHASASSTAHPMGTLPQPSRAPRFRDRLSHLSFDGASKILGHNGRRLLIRGGALELAAPDDLRIDEHEARVQWEPGPGGLTSRLFFDPSVRGGLRAVCSACTRPCEHVGGLLSILLEQNASASGVTKKACPPVSSFCSRRTRSEASIGPRTSG
jgi:hypothetical protein